VNLELLPKTAKKMDRFLVFGAVSVLLAACSETHQKEPLILTPMSKEFEYSTPMARLRESHNALKATPGEIDELNQASSDVFQKVEKLNGKSQWAASTQLLKDLLEKQKQLFGVDSIHLVHTYNQLRKELQHLHDFAGAHQCADEASRIADLCLGFIAPDATRYKLHSINVIWEAGDREKAISTLTEFVARLKANRAGISSEALARYQLAKYYEDENRLAESIKQLQLAADLKHNSIASYSIEPRQSELIERIMKLKGRAAWTKKAVPPVPHEGVQ
jgi:tetratricopeptide (TPR) repeat protein